GRYVQFNLKEKQFENKLNKMLGLVMPHRLMAWIVNHYVCSKLAWSFMVQNYSDTDAKQWQAHIHRRYRKWFGLAKSAEGSILYRTHEHFGLKLKSLPQMREQLQVTKVHIMKYSKDDESKNMYYYRLNMDQKGHVGQGRKTSPCLTLE